MKKILAAILASALLLSFTGCQQKSDFEKAKDYVEDATKDMRERRDERNKMIEEDMIEVSDALLSLQTAELKIKSYAIVPSSYDETKTDIVFLADFTNNSDSTRSFNYGSFADSNLIGYQNGIQLDQSLATADRILDGSKDIKPGATFEIMLAMTLEDDSTDIELEFYYMDNNSDSIGPATYTLKIK